MIYLLHIYCIFARYSYDILINYICFLFFLCSILYHQLTYNRDVLYISWLKWHGMLNGFCFSMMRHVIDIVQKYFFSVQLLLYSSKNIFSTSCILYAWLAISHVPFVLNSLLIVMYKCQCVCTVCNFYILFCVGMLGGNCGWSDMAWQMNLS